MVQIIGLQNLIAQFFGSARWTKKGKSTRNQFKSYYSHAPTDPKIFYCLFLLFPATLFA
jgi:hypothetical protein